MNQALWISMGIAAGVGIGWLVQLLLLRPRRSMIGDPAGADTGPSPSIPAPRRLPPATSPRPKAFHGVSLNPGPDPCDAVQSVLGRRYLSNDAPALPLPGCDRQRCGCTYGHYRDRRDADDRRSGWGTFGGFAAPVAGGNRRSTRPDRRFRKKQKQT